MNVHAMRRILAQDIERVETEALEARERMKAAPTESALVQAETDYACCVASLARKVALFERGAR